MIMKLTMSEATEVLKTLNIFEGVVSIRVILDGHELTINKYKKGHMIIQENDSSNDELYSSVSEFKEAYNLK